MAKLYSYVVARDYGFAPNPFYGVCTLATCKPGIRKHAKIGDWIVGTGSSDRGRTGYLVFVMLVSETMSFNEYWENPLLQAKVPNLRGSKKQAFGDNIYFKDLLGTWHQADSHHSYSGGSSNSYNIDNDTGTDRLLLGSEFTYWGGSGPQVPAKFRNYYGWDICAIRNYKCRFPDTLAVDFEAWFRSLDVQGYLGDPADWEKTP